MDGTFKTAPKLFKQLYIVHAKLGDTAISCAYALLTDKTQESYEELLQALVNRASDTCRV